MGKKVVEKYPGILKMFKKTARYYPVMRSIILDQKEKLLIELYQTQELRKNSYKTIYDIFSKDGKYLHTMIIMEKVLTPLLFQNNYVYYISESKTGAIVLKKCLYKGNK